MYRFIYFRTFYKFPDKVECGTARGHQKYSDYTRSRINKQKYISNWVSVNTIAILFFSNVKTFKINSTFHGVHSLKLYPFVNHKFRICH